MRNTFLILVCLFSISLFSLPIKKLEFQRLTMKNGLSSNEVNCIFKDSKGFVWFGTNDGLNRYDGLRMKVFKHESANKNSIAGNKIRSIVEDLNGNLWISCDGGLLKFNRETEQFKHFSLATKNNIAEKTIGLLHVDYQGFLWVGLQGQTLLIDTKTGKAKNFFEKEHLNKLIGNKTIINFFEDSKRNLWLSAWGVGLLKVDAKRENISLYNHDPKNPNSLSDNNILTVYEDKFHRLWMGTFEHGLCIFDQANNKFTGINSPSLGTVLLTIVADVNNQLWICQGHSVAIIKNLDPSQITIYRNNSADLKSFTADYAHKLYKDNTGIMWFGTTNDGICYHDPNANKFSHFNAFNNVGSEQEKYYVKSIGFYGLQNVLIGTLNHGLLYFNVDTKKMISYKAGTSALASNNVHSICTMPSGLVWIGTSAGISIFNPQSQKITGQINTTNGLFNNSVQKIFKDSKSNIWVATENGLDLIRNGKFTHFSQNGLSEFKIYDIVEDKNRNIWIATDYGLHKYNIENQKFTQYINSNNSQLSSSEILSLLVDAKGVLWLGTRSGLNRYKRETNTFEPYLKNSEIADKPIYKIIEDNDKELWLSSNPELYKLNVETGIVRAYNESDGLVKNTVALEKGPDGKIYVGGKHTGFYAFEPSQIDDNPLLPEIVITGLLVNNKRVNIELDIENAILQKSISSTNEITLPYNQSMLEFELAALNYTLPEKNRFAYKLEGIDTEWILLGTGKSTIPLTYLQPGKYNLKIKGSNNDGLWNEKGVSMRIVIQPPFWRSNLAYFLYFLLAVAALLWYRLYTLNRFKQNSKAEIDQLKLRFFANVSHELRTPLTLIAGPLNKLMTEVKQRDLPQEQLMEQFSLMHRNTERLLLLTNQLLDLQKTQTGSMKLNLSQGNIILFLKSLFETFVPLADEKNIQFNFTSSTQELFVKFDADKLEKIVDNLLTNAFKFTKSSVKLMVKTENDQLVIEVMDNGVGMERDELQKIFQNFYQIDRTNSAQNKGTGIGLALTRELVLLHKGTIEVESNVGKGSVFKVLLPLDFVTEKDIFPAIEHQELLASSTIVSEINQPAMVDKSKPLVLIVEDNPDMRLYIRNILKDNYRLLEAENGKIGVQKAIDKMPDLIISDVMMAEMDGMELCERVKNDALTSHIPVILLTALGATESKLKGLQIGADDYITKPFNAELLLARIKNLIEMRKQLQLKFKQSVVVDPSEIVTNVGDEKLLKKAIELIETNIENLDFGIKEFIEGMPVSRRGLYDKLKAITGMTVSEFIISIRLRHAAKLLLTKEFSISEITYKVGFQNRSQLNRAFKDQFSMSPTEYIRAHQSDKQG